MMAELAADAREGCSDPTKPRATGQWRQLTRVPACATDRVPCRVRHQGRLDGLRVMVVTLTVVIAGVIERYREQRRR